MRLKESDLKEVYLRKRTVGKDNQGYEKVDYESDYTELEMNVQSAGGAVAAQIYGERLPSIKSCKYQGDKLQEGRNEKDGICLFVEPSSPPDFEIVSIQTFSTHLNVTLERL